MPRAKAISDAVKPKRTTTSRSSRSVSATKAAGSPTVRRKAPTTITSKPHSYSSLKSISITLGVFALIIGGSAFVGMADSGQINVTGVIQERDQNLREEGKEDEANRLSIPKSDGLRRPNGGLRPSNTDGASAAPTPAPATLGAEDSTEENTLASDENNNEDVSSSVEEEGSNTPPPTEPTTETELPPEEPASL